MNPGDEVDLIPYPDEWAIKAKWVRFSNHSHRSMGTAFVSGTSNGIATTSGNGVEWVLLRPRRGWTPIGEFWWPLEYVAAARARYAVGWGGP